MRAWIKQAKEQNKSNQGTEETDPELLTRTSWVDARTAYNLVERGESTGNKCALLIRSYVQQRLYKLGCFQQRHCGKVLIIGTLFLCLLAVGLKTAVIESDIMKLWVEEGGRLSKELDYTKSILGENYGSSSLIIVQTPGGQSRNVLTRDSLLQHVQALVKATNTEVHLFDRIWTFDDICFKATFPSFEDGLIESMMEKIIPCVIISPLDCFWEGSIALGPSNPLILPPSFGADPLTWKSLNPQTLLQLLEATMPYSFDVIKDTLRRAGITQGYQNRPCLNPLDPECPPDAPNYRSREPVDSVASALTGGCYGISESYMHWQEDLIVGGAIKNRTNSMVSGEAVQTIVQLMGERELYNYYQGTYLVSSIDWTPEKARQILEVFQKKFTESVVSYNEMANVTDSFSSFTEASLDELVQSFSEISYLRLGMGYALLLVYSVLALMNFCNAVQSHAGLGIAGVLLVSLSIAAGLGLCALLNLSFNATTTQIVPFIALGLGVDDIFLMAYAFANNSIPPVTNHQEQAAVVLKRAGPTVLLTSICNIAAFLLAAIIPIPALRVFALQVGILLTVNMVTVLLVLPAMLSLDAWRKSNDRVDVLCCMESVYTTRVKDISMLPPPSPPDSGVHNTLTFSHPSGDNGVTTILAPLDYTEQEGPAVYSASSSQNLTDGTQSSLCCDMSASKCCTPSLDRLVERFYIPFLEKTSFRVIICVLTVTLLCAGAYGISKVKVGMELTDIVPRGSNEHTFLEAQSKYFGFYDMYLVTKDNFDYHTAANQQLLRQLHSRISELDNVIESDESANRGLWLDFMARWLNDLQQSFDSYSSSFHTSGWYPNASDDAVLAYKLLIQTGDVSNPIDRSRPARVRLVDDNGVISPHAFYNYLTAWIYNDPFAFDISQATIRPLPTEWYYVPSDSEDILIPRAPAIQFARMPFYLHSLGTTELILQTVKEIRDICDYHTEQGLENYPSGMIFTFWEQYLHIHTYLLISLSVALGAIFFIVMFAMMSPLAALLITVTLAVITFELFGLMGLAGVKLSAVPAVILVMSVGIGVEFTVHILSAFMTCIGNRVLRVKRSLSYMFTPVVHGAVSTLLGVIMLAVSEFDFIVRYFFLCFLALLLLALFNGLVFFPVLLSMVGPVGDVQPSDKDATCISLPKAVSHVKSKKSRPKKPKKAKQEADVLSTIAEEPSQFSSTSSCEEQVTVKPTVNVETTVEQPSTVHRTASSDSRQRSRQRGRPVTKVKATVTVEVHADLPGCADESPPACRMHSRSSKRMECVCSDSETSV